MRQTFIPPAPQAGHGVSAIAAVGVVGEAMVAFVLAEVFLETFGADPMKEMTRRGDLQQTQDYTLRPATRHYREAPGCAARAAESEGASIP
jgi:hypothetical protein